MITNIRLKYLSSLKLKKYRKQERKFLIEGENLLEAALHFNADIEEIYISSEYGGALLQRINQIDIPVFKISPAKMERISNVKTPQGVAALLPFFRHDSNNCLSADRILYLENLSDPGNTGTLIRDAKAFNFDCVFISSGGCEVYNPKLLRSTAGYIFSIPVIEGIELDLISNYKNHGFSLISTNPHAEITIEGEKCPERAIIMLGNEPHGLSEKAEKLADRKLRISINEEVESLNAASSGAIIMHWANI